MSVERGARSWLTRIRTRQHGHAGDQATRSGSPAPSSSRTTSTAATVNQTSGVVPAAESSVKRGDARHRAADVDGVGPQRLHALEQGPERQGQRSSAGRSPAGHDQRQDQEVRVRRAALGEAEEQLVGISHLDVQLRLVDEDDHGEQQQRERQDAGCGGRCGRAGSRGRCPGSWPSAGSC